MTTLPSHPYPQDELASLRGVCLSILQRLDELAAVKIGSSHPLAGRALALRRKALGLTQEQFAEKANVARATVSEIEREQAESPQMRAHLAATLARLESER